MTPLAASVWRKRWSGATRARDTPPPDDTPDPEDSQSQDETQQIPEEMLVEAALAALPRDLLQALAGVKLPIAPLFETLDDLQRAPAILAVSEDGSGVTTQATGSTFIVFAVVVRPSVWHGEIDKL